MKPHIDLSSGLTVSPNTTLKITRTLGTWTLGWNDDALNWHEQEENQPKTNTNQLPRKYSMIGVSGMCL